jgi:hypothetical protein
VKLSFKFKIVSVLASENFLSKSLLFTPVAPRLKTKALLLMSMDLLMSMVLLMSVDSCEKEHKKPLCQSWLAICHPLQYLTVLTLVPAMDNIVVNTELFIIKIMAMMSVDSCERAVETAEFADVLPCKKSSIRLRSLERLSRMCL